jgi:hypothetical protein
MDAHGHSGCGGDRRRACRCARDRFTALDDAVNAARRSADSDQDLRLSAQSPPR